MGLGDLKRFAWIRRPDYFVPEELQCVSDRGEYIRLIVHDQDRCSGRIVSSGHAYSSEPWPTSWLLAFSPEISPAGTAFRPKLASDPGGDGRLRGLAELCVPGPGEASLVAGLGKGPLLVPLAPRELVVDLEAVAVGIGEIHADRDRMVGDPDGHPAVVQALVHLLEVIEVRHPPRDVIQADLPLLLPLRIVPDLEQRDVVGVARVAGEKRRPHPVRAGEVEDVLRVQAQDVRIPAVRALGVADEDVDVIESNGLAGHGGCLLVHKWSKLLDTQYPT